MRCMKKQYITPQIERVCAVTINIMDFSITINGGKSGIAMEDGEGNGDDQAVSIFEVWDMND